MSTDQVADALRRAANGDQAAQAEFHQLRAARVRAHRDMRAEADANARRILARACQQHTNQ